MHLSLASRRIGRPSIAAEKLLWTMLHQLRGKLHESRATCAPRKRAKQWA